MDSMVLYVLNFVPQAMPDELFAITPPSVAAPSDAGSGPILRPYGARCALTWRTVDPGWTRTRLPPSSTSTPRKCLRTSTSMPAPPAWPDSEVPPERNTTGAPDVAEARNAAATSWAVRASTTTSGV